MTHGRTRQTCPNVNITRVRDAVAAEKGRPYVVISAPAFGCETKCNTAILLAGHEPIDSRIKTVRIPILRQFGLPGLPVISRVGAAGAVAKTTAFTVVAGQAP